MKRFLRSRFFHRFNTPVAVLLALLQRTPVAHLAAEGESIVFESPIGTVLRSVLTAAAALGAVQSMAGATPLVATPSADSDGLTTTVGASVSVFYTVTGTQTPPASWRVTGSIPPGLSFSGLTGSGGVVNVENLHLSGSPTTAGSYDVTITTYQGTDATLIASPDYAYTIVVNPGVTAPPTFTTNPQSQSVTAGATVTFSVAASGSPSPTFQWQKDGANISGATASTLSLANVTTADAGTYAAVATNSAGSVTSTGATLTVSALSTLPAFTEQPAAEVAVAGGSATFAAAASGTPAPSYQWQRNGLNLTDGGNISGATTGVLTVSNVGAADLASYTVVASNSAGAVTSNPAMLTLGTPSDQGHIVNMSVLTSIKAGESFAFGYFVGGSGTTGTKPVLMRAMGPTLGAAPFNIGGTLGDPYMEFYNGSTLVSSNDNWGGDASVRTAAAAVGAFPFASDTSKDAAIYNPAVTLSVGHSIHVSGVNGTSGTVIAELYDATPGGEFTASTPRLTNVSLLKNVGATTTLGFYIGGSTAVKVLIRAIGPTIGAAPFNVAGAIADPKMALYSQGNTTVPIATNDNWGGTADLQAAFSATGAFNLDPSSKDAALVETLQPGGYSVQVSPSIGATGTALIEVYEVP